MSLGKLLLLIVGVTLVITFIARCGAPAATPEPTFTAALVPPTLELTSTPTLVPPTLELTSTPTLVPPTPELTSTPTLVPPTPELTSTPTLVPPTLEPTSTPTLVPLKATPTLEPQAQVILAWHEAWNNKDIDAFMALVADDAILDRGPHGVITGKEKIRAIVLLEMEESLQAKVSKFVVEGNQVTYYYEVFIYGSKVDQGVAVAIVENGKIKSDLPAK